MSADTEKKKTGRQMMRMIEDINKRYFGGKDKVSCEHCHRGKAKPEL